MLAEWATNKRFWAAAYRVEEAHQAARWGPSPEASARPPGQTPTARIAKPRGRLPAHARMLGCRERWTVPV